MDPRGVAGGMHGAPNAVTPFGIDYHNTTHAKGGDLGSRLPRKIKGTVWMAGDVVEVSWTISANHGGGYYWQLCRVPEDGTPVTEACFQRTPLRFVGQTRFRWDANPSTEEEIDNIFVSTSTMP